MGRRVALKRPAPVRHLLGVEQMNEEMNVMGDSVRTESTLCRSVTAEEVDHLHEFGWVKLKSFVDPGVIAAMLEVAREVMGEDADSNAPPLGASERLGLVSEETAPAEEQVNEPFVYFNPQSGGGLSNPVIRPLIYELGKSAKVLQRRPSVDGQGVGVRYYTDYFVPKLPSSKESRHGGNGPTAFHQDFISHGVDRSGGLTFWIPFEAYGAVAGTMSFLNRSHRAGVLGHYMTHGDGDVVRSFPELAGLEVSEPMTYEVGDLTVHDHLTVHGAGENLMDRPRWAYILLTQPADVRWNGSPCPNFDWTVMKPLDLFSDECLPPIG
jgi:hypothetical protein